MSTERIERIRAEEVRDGDRIKAPEGRAFYRIEKATLRPGLDSPDDDQVELDAGWGSVRLDLGETVERENWRVGDAKAEIGEQMRGRLDDLALIIRTRDAGEAPDDVSSEALEALGFSLEGGDAVEEAERLLDEYPLSVETTTVFEVVIGTGGPDDRLIFECSGSSDVPEPFEIDRVLYRYSWTGSAERVLDGEDRETAEELARRVVPELVE